MKHSTTNTAPGVRRRPGRRGPRRHPFRFCASCLSGDRHSCVGTRVLTLRQIGVAGRAGVAWGGARGQGSRGRSEIGPRCARPSAAARRGQRPAAAHALVGAQFVAESSRAERARTVRKAASIEHRAVRGFLSLAAPSGYGHWRRKSGNLGTSTGPREDLMIAGNAGPSSKLSACAVLLRQ